MLSDKTEHYLVLGFTYKHRNSWFDYLSRQWFYCLWNWKYAQVRYWLKCGKSSGRSWPFICFGQREAIESQYWFDQEHSFSFTVIIVTEFVGTRKLVRVCGLAVLQALIQPWETNVFFLRPGRLTVKRYSRAFCLATLMGEKYVCCHVKTAGTKGTETNTWRSWATDCRWPCLNRVGWPRWPPGAPSNLQPPCDFKEEKKKKKLNFKWIYFLFGGCSYFYVLFNFLCKS